MLFVPSTDHVLVEVRSTSVEVKVPEALAVPSTPVPTSVTAPTLAASELEMTGASFVPVIVTMTVWSTRAP